MIKSSVILVTYKAIQLIPCLLAPFSLWCWAYKEAEDFPISINLNLPLSVFLAGPLCCAMLVSAIYLLFRMYNIEL